VRLFLNGKDRVSNLELGDMDVYLQMCVDLWNAVKNLPEGTPIDRVLIHARRK
jgi:hypothetical protein